MDYPTHQSKPESNNSFFDGARYIEEYDRNQRMRGLGAAEGKELEASNVAVPGVRSIDGGVSDFRPGLEDPLKASNERMDKLVETLFIDAAERGRRYAEQLQAQALGNEDIYKSRWPQGDLKARLDMAEQIRKQEQQERKEHKKSWHKYMPW